MPPVVPFSRLRPVVIGNITLPNPVILAPMSGVTDAPFRRLVADLGAGETIETVQDAYSLSREQVLTALRYAAHLAAHLPPAVSEAS